MFKKNFMSATKFGETKNDLEATAAEWPPCLRAWPDSWPESGFVFVQGG